MPGAYAHITAVNLASEIHRLQKAKVPASVARPLGRYRGFLELGAVSPDYPYLDVNPFTGSKRWADQMHYVRTGQMLGAGLRLLPSLSGEAREKATAWLLGYAAHLVADLTIHPVVECRVGPYETNARDHRTCEMHQDAYIFQRLNLGPVGVAEHLDSGIARCGGAMGGGLDGTISELWLGMFQEVYPDEYANDPPDVHAWHNSFRFVVDTVEESDKLFPIARHVASEYGCAYPAVDGIDKSYIERLQTPTGQPMDYDLIFDVAIDNILDMWRRLGEALDGTDASLYADLGNWNLDTGKDEQGDYLYWEVA